jgi:hypothetical protein
MPQRTRQPWTPENLSRWRTVASMLFFPRNSASDNRKSEGGAARGPHIQEAHGADRRVS